MKLVKDGINETVDAYKINRDREHTQSPTFPLMTNYCLKHLRVPFCKNRTNFKFRDKGRNFDFAHFLMVDSLGYDKEKKYSWWCMAVPQIVKRV